MFKISGDLQAVAIGATNLVFTVLAMLVIDRAGRRFVLTIGAVGTAACMGGVTAIFATGRHGDLLLWLLIGFIASFAFSQGARFLSGNIRRVVGETGGTAGEWFASPRG